MDRTLDRRSPVRAPVPVVEDDRSSEVDAERAGPWWGSLSEAGAPVAALPAARIQQLQRLAGNRAVGALLDRPRSPLVVQRADAGTDLLSGLPDIEQVPEPEGQFEGGAGGGAPGAAGVGASPSAAGGGGPAPGGAAAPSGSVAPPGGTSPGPGLGLGAPAVAAAGSPAGAAGPSAALGGSSSASGGNGPAAGAGVSSGGPAGPASAGSGPAPATGPGLASGGPAGAAGPTTAGAPDAGTVGAGPTTASGDGGAGAAGPSAAGGAPATGTAPGGPGTTTGAPSTASAPGGPAGAAGPAAAAGASGGPSNAGADTERVDQVRSLKTGTVAPVPGTRPGVVGLSHPSGGSSGGGGGGPTGGGASTLPKSSGQTPLAGPASAAGGQTGAGLATQGPGSSATGPGIAGPGAAGPGIAGPAAAPGGGGGAPSAASGIDWHQFWQNQKWNVARTVLEAGRMIPGWGLLPGLASDAINGWQDVSSLNGVDADGFKTAMVVRDAFSALDNVVGTVSYNVQLVQDIATASVVASEADAALVPINEFLSGLKAGMDGSLMAIDLIMESGALYNEINAPPGSAEEGKWRGVVNNYANNILGDTISVILDITSLASGGFSNSEGVKDVANEGKNVFSISKAFWNAFKGASQGWLSTWGGNTPWHGIVKMQAGQTIVQEAAVIQLVYDGLTELIDAAADSVADQIAQMELLLTVLNDGQDPVVQIRDAGVAGLAAMQQKIGQLQQLETSAGTAHDKATTIASWCDDATSTVNGLQVPHLTVPQADTGSDTLDAVVNTVGGAAQVLVDELTSKITDLVTEAKSSIGDGLNTIKSNASDIAQFLQILQDQTAQQITYLQTTITDFMTKLANCQDFNQLFNTLLDEIGKAIGFDQGLSFEALRADWAQLGPLIPQLQALGQRLQEEGEEESKAALPAMTPPPDGGAGGGAGAPVPAATP